MEKGKKWLKLTMGSRNPILPPSLKKIIAPTGKDFQESGTLTSDRFNYEE